MVISLHCKEWVEALTEMEIWGSLGDGDTNMKLHIESEVVPLIGERLDYNYSRHHNNNRLVGLDEQTLIRVEQLLNGCYRIVDLRYIVYDKNKLHDEIALLLERIPQNVKSNKIFGF
jgi:hypothetical protein